ncbi:MAG: peptidylprolyl isomerase [Alphaproteobacteria bacterium]|nr:peptidylprolyl isomerase [Alphaproteobacteria bacterium]
MRHHTARLAAFALALSLGPVAALAAEDPVVARVDGAEIRRSALENLQKADPQMRMMPIEVVFAQLVDVAVAEQLVLNEARKLKLHDNAKVKERVEEARQRIMQDAYLRQRVDSVLTDDILKKKYQEIITKMPAREEVKARHILVETEQQAKDVIAKLGKGAKFEDLAKEVSKDPGTKDSGGDLGFFGKGEMVKEFAEAAFALKNGEITQTPVKTDFGFHVIKVEDRRKAEAPPFDSVKDQLRQMAGQETVVKVVNELRDKAKIETFGPDGKPVAPAAPEKK